MRFYILMLALIILALVGTGGYGQVFRGYYSDGTREFRAHESNGRTIIKGYYQDGSIEFSSSYKNNQLDGPTKRYYENGFVQCEINYKNDRREGPSRLYFPNGMLMARLEFLADTLYTTVRLYDSAGATLRHADKQATEEILRNIFAADTLFSETK